jgi:hypothetical protein
MKRSIKLVAAPVVTCAFLAASGVAAAHPHVASVAHQGSGQVIANGQLHAPFDHGVSCGGDPAAYGLESAHHGPDAGTPGKADGCYMTTGGLAPGDDVSNPVIQ